MKSLIIVLSLLDVTMVNVQAQDVVSPSLELTIAIARARLALEDTDLATVNLRSSSPAKQAVAPTLPRPVEGQKSPGGEWSYSAKQNAWIPVKLPGPMWTESGSHQASVEHLVREHGYDRKTVERLTPEQRRVLHANAHNRATAKTPAKVSASDDCPDGQCPSSSSSSYYKYEYRSRNRIRVLPRRR